MGRAKFFAVYSRWRGLERVQFFPPSPLRVGSNIPVTVHALVATQHIPVTVQSLAAQSMTFHTNPGHLLYPARITFAASSGPPGKVNFKISLAGDFPNSTRKLQFRALGNSFEDAQWNHFLSQVAAFCAGGRS